MVERRCSSRAGREWQEVVGEGGEEKRRKDRPKTTRFKKRRREKGITDHQSRNTMIRAKLQIRKTALARKKGANLNKSKLRVNGSEFIFT